ncbi:MAG TPA: YdcF family protein [Alphaproteobacteria bacterium]|nr:YdcF family protein [Alphaproteobacteria bacterium]
MIDRLIARFVILASGLAAVAWLLGLLVFVADVNGMAEVEDAAAPTDAIVVLTGGSERIDAGLQLLKAGKGHKLFISGVHPGLKLDQLLTGQTVPKDLHDCCIILGHAAETTIGNAEETQTWMGIENYHSMRLVTSNYHMRRSLMIFHAAMPEMKIVPSPVVPDSVKLDRWWQRHGTASLLIVEYDKYLLAMFRLWLGQD